jgi:hypothetical protein
VQLVVLGEQQHDVAGIQQGPGALDDEFEDPVDVGLAAERPGDRRRRLQRADGLLELDAPALLGRVGPSVVDRDAGPPGQQLDRLLVVGV